MSSITFIKDPNFTVDFSQYSPVSSPTKSRSTIEKTVDVAAFGLNCVKFFFIALGKSLYETASYSGVSFKHIVLGIHGSLWNFRPSADLPIVILKVAVWVFAMTWNTAATTGRLWMEQISPSTPETQGKNYMSSDLNLAHIRTDELALDASGVPVEITVDSLLGILEEINFDDEAAPGYMAPTSRQEYNTVFTKEQLKINLEKFITRVNNREAFLGTPPSHDTPRLMAFYQQIEDAVRISIYTMEQKLTAFKSVNGIDGENNVVYDDAKRKEYHNILEDKARIAIDLSIAGSHCGARYMGEAMTVYNTLKGESSSNDKNLEDTLVEILANKRRQVAEAQIQTHLDADTHTYANYMGTMGSILAIPGTKNVIEQLAGSLDKDRFLRLFYKEYTVDAIIETIQEKVKSSNSFREKIIDWVRDQIGTWSPVSDEGAQKLKSDISTQIAAIIESQATNAASSSAVTPLENLQNLLTFLKNAGVPLPAVKGNWDDFIIDLLALDEAKEWCNVNLPGVPHERFAPPIIAKRNAFKNACLENKHEAVLISTLIQEIKDNGTISALPNSQEDDAQKIADIRSVFNKEKLPPPSEDTIKRMIKGETNVSEVIEGIWDAHSRSEFTHELKLATLHESGLSPELLEWILVSQKILNPQCAAVKEEVTANQAVVTQNPKLRPFINTVLEQYKKSESTSAEVSEKIENWINTIKLLTSEVVESEAEKILASSLGTNNKRHHFATSSRDRLLTLGSWIFFAKKHSPFFITSLLWLHILFRGFSKDSISFYRSLAEGLYSNTTLR